MRLILSLFYILLLAVPTQLGRHFFFYFSSIFGIRNDYLTPTLFLTDIIIILMVVIWIVEKIKNRAVAARRRQRSKIKSKHSNFKITDLILWSIFCYLLFSSIFIATNVWVALYKLLKIIEFVLLGIIIYRIKPNMLAIITIFSIDIFYTSLIAVGQFIMQKSIGGILWWLGERTFYANTPGIATFSLFGRLLLRPYATFPHPNVLGGFLAVGLPILLFFLLYPSNTKIYRHKHIGIFLYSWFFICFSTGLIVLFLSLSRAALIVSFVGFALVIFRKKLLNNWLRKRSSFSLVIFYILITVSVVIPLVMHRVSFVGQSWRERGELIAATLNMVEETPLFGVGLNNSIIRLRNFVSNPSGLYIFQPVHNIYLLTMVETGLIGFFIFLIFLIVIFLRSLKAPSIVALALVQLCLLGFFDHYLFTLQQGQLLFTLFASLALYRTV